MAASATLSFCPAPSSHAAWFEEAISPLYNGVEQKNTWEIENLKSG